MDRRRLVLPLLVLLAGLVATLAASSIVLQAELDRRRVRFEAIADAAARSIDSKMQAQITLLRGAAGLFNANSGRVAPEEFRAYVDRLRLQTNYPGVLGIGFAAFAPDRQRLAETMERAYADGVPRDVKHWPAGDRDGYSVILYLEPQNRLNRVGLGYDMLSEPERRGVMERSRQSGLGELSGRVRLVQEIDAVKQPGFLLYMPLFANGQYDDLRAIDPSMLYGWVYSPLRAYDLFGTVFRDRDVAEAGVEIFDGAIDEDRLLYRIGETQTDPDHVRIRPLRVAGRDWLIRVSSTPVFDSGRPFVLPIIIGTAGTLISLLVAALLWQQMRSAARTERKVEARTAELREANVRLQAEAEAREQAEAQMRQMQKIEAVGQLTGGIAHDFNNMLAVIIGNLDMAERRMAQPQRVQRAIANARIAASRASDLTQRLLAFSRQQALQPRPIDVNRLVANMSELLRRSLGETIRLETRLPDGAWKVNVDASQLESAILNLAINSRDAMREGGQLTIETGNCSLDEAYARDHDGAVPGDYVQIAVTDTGVGMEREVAERAIEPFFTTKEVGKGTGLGLSQVYGFVKQSGGYVAIDSEPGRGTTVNIYLPRHGGADSAEEREEPEYASLPGGRSDELVLVVEDEDQVREFSTETLRDLGYSVLAAPNGPAALEILRQRSDIRLLFTDVVMPEMNGRQLVDQARALRPGLKCIFTTGYARDAIGPQGSVDQGVALLQKPFTVAQLAVRVRQELDR